MTKGINKTTATNYGVNVNFHAIFSMGLFPEKGIVALKMGAYVDEATHDEGAKPLAVYDIAISPEDAQVILAFARTGESEAGQNLYDVVYSIISEYPIYTEA